MIRGLVSATNARTVASGPCAAPVARAADDGDTVAERAGVKVT
jgi:hypothetical protein